MDICRVCRGYLVEPLGECGDDAETRLATLVPCGHVIHYACALPGSGALAVCPVCESAVASSVRLYLRVPPFATSQSTSPIRNGASDHADSSYQPASSEQPAQYELIDLTIDQPAEGRQEDLEGTRSYLLAELTNIKDDVGHLRERLQDLKAECKRQELVKKRLSQEVPAQQLEVEALTDRIRTAERALDDDTTKDDRLRERICLLQDSVAAAGRDLDGQQAANAHLTRQLEDRRTLPPSVDLAALLAHREACNRSPVTDGQIVQLVRECRGLDAHLKTLLQRQRELTIKIERQKRLLKSASKG